MDIAAAENISLAQRCETLQDFPENDAELREFVRSGAGLKILCRRALRHAIPMGAYARAVNGMGYIELAKLLPEPEFDVVFDRLAADMPRMRKEPSYPNLCRALAKRGQPPWGRKHHFGFAAEHHYANHELHSEELTLLWDDCFMAWEMMNVE